MPRLAGVVVVLALAVPASAVVGQERNCEGEGTVRVSVLDESESLPVPGATVVLHWGGADRERESVGLDGRLVLCAPGDATRATLWAERDDVSSTQRGSRRGTRYVAGHRTATATRVVGDRAPDRLRARLMTPRLLPAVTFLTMSLVAFATASFRGIFAVAIPIVLPLADSVGAEMPLVIGALISASAFGSHTCFYGDSTVLAARGSGCGVVEHALTQLPYALFAAGLAAAGFLLLA